MYAVVVTVAVVASIDVTAVALEVNVGLDDRMVVAVVRVVTAVVALVVVAMAVVVVLIVAVVVVIAFAVEVVGAVLLVVGLVVVEIDDAAEVLVDDTGLLIVVMMMEMVEDIDVSGRTPPPPRVVNEG